MATLCWRITLIISDLRKDCLIVDPFFTNQELQELLEERNGKRWFGRKYKYKSELVMVDSDSFLRSRLTKATNRAAAYALEHFYELATREGLITAESLEKHRLRFPSSDAMVEALMVSLRFLGKLIDCRIEDSLQWVQTQAFQPGAQGSWKPTRKRTPIYGIKRHDLISWFEHYGVNSQFY